MSPRLRRRRRHNGNHSKIGLCLEDVAKLHKKAARKALERSQRHKHRDLRDCRVVVERMSFDMDALGDALDGTLNLDKQKEVIHVKRFHGSPCRTNMNKLSMIQKQAPMTSTPFGNKGSQTSTHTRHKSTEIVYHTSRPFDSGIGGDNSTHRMTSDPNVGNRTNLRKSSRVKKTVSSEELKKREKNIDTNLRKKKTKTVHKSNPSFMDSLFEDPVDPFVKLNYEDEALPQFVVSSLFADVSERLCDLSSIDGDAAFDHVMDDDAEEGLLITPSLATYSQRRSTPSPRRQKSRHKSKQDELFKKWIEESNAELNRVENYDMCIV